MLSPLPAPVALHGDASTSERIPRMLQDRAVGIVIAAFFAVHRELGHGFLDTVYQRALALEFSSRGLKFEQDATVSVFYKGSKVGHQRVPFLVENRITIELRSSPRLDSTDERLLVQGIRASGCEAGLLLHFGVAATFRHMERDGNGVPSYSPRPHHGPS